MKLSDGFRGLGKMWSGLVKGFDNLETAMAITGAFFGKNPGEGAETKGRKFALRVYGLFGFEDEREFILLLNKIRGGGCRDTVLGWFAWQFPQETQAQRAVAKWYGNNFRTFVLKLGEGDDRIAFLYRMAQTIRNNGGGEAGYKALRKELLLQNIPLPPDGIVGQVQFCIDRMKATWETVQLDRVALENDTLCQEQKLRNRRKNKPWIRKILGY